MASLRRGYLHRKSSKHTSTNMATARAPSHWASGATIFNRCLSRYVWTILASSKLGVNMPSTLPPSSMNITNANRNGKVNGTWAWTLIGTTQAALSTSPCLNTYPKHSGDFNTNLRVSHNISRAPTSRQITAPKRSSQKMSAHPCFLTKRAKNTSKRSLVLSCITFFVSTAPFYLDSVLLHCNNPIQQKTPKICSINSLTMPPRIPMPSSHKASNMVFAGHSNASYLSETNARSHAGGHFIMSNNDPIPANNGAIHTTSQIIKAVMSSVAEAEIGALYINCREAIPSQHTLKFLGHKQPPTPMQTDNTTALGMVNNNIMKKLKAMDMKYHWL